MKRIILLTVIINWLFINALTAQNPFKEFGVDVPVITLSKGKYPEFIPNDTIHRIGTVVIDTRTGKIIELINTDSIEITYNYRPDVASRWISPDPLAEEYWDWSPYNYVLNDPINNIDPDGMDVVDMGDRIVINGDDLIFYLSALQAVSSGQSSWSNFMEAATDAAKKPDEGSGHFKGALLAENTPSNNPSVTSGNKTGYVYNQSDLAIRNSVLQSDNPIGRYIQSQEQAGIYDILNGHDYWMKYGHTLGNMMLMQTYIVEGLGLATAAQSGTNQPTPKGFNCFVGSTPIATNNGFKKIADITITDKVWSFNELTKKIELKQVVNTKRKETDKLVKIIVGLDTILCTPEHPFYINGDWVEAQNMKIGDKVFINSKTKSYLAESLYIQSISLLDTTTTVYNFEVQDNHNYFVGLSKILVHNDCTVGELIPGSLKRSKSYHEDYAHYTVEQLKSMGNDRKAKQMLKLVQQKDRLMNKVKNK